MMRHDTAWAASGGAALLQQLALDVCERPIDGIDVQSAQHTGEPARCGQMLTEMLEMQEQMLAQMLGPLRCWLLRLSAWQQMSQMLLADVAGLGSYYSQMLADDAGLADAADRMVQRLKEARIEAIEAQSKLVWLLTSPMFPAPDAGN